MSSLWRARLLLWTGGASGIGPAIGDAYAVKGATVVVLDLAMNAAQRKVSVGSAAAAFVVT
jgi:NAD(P)-dependent dehydrogenase (short-subunit alcohol dehydrogenase family)